MRAQHSQFAEDDGAQGSKKTREGEASKLHKVSVLFFILFFYLIILGPHITFAGEAGIFEESGTHGLPCHARGDGLQGEPGLNK